MNKKFDRDIVLEKFFNLCKSMGVDLLRDDKSYLRGLTKHLQIATMRNVLFEYTSVWKLAMDEEESKSRKQNKGRFAANTWIRGYLNKK